MIEYLKQKGGQLEQKLLPYPAAVHLDFAERALNVFLKPLAMPSTVIGGTKIVEPSKVASFSFVKKWNVNAFTALVEEKPVVVFHGGVPFALIELFHSLLSLPTVLVEYEGEREPQANYNSFKPPPENYSFLINTDKQYNLIWTENLPMKPKSKLRDQLATNLYMNALIFLFLHELGHIDSGHLELILRQYGATDLPEFNVSEEQDVLMTNRVLQCLELDADNYALDRLFPVLIERNQKSKNSHHYSHENLRDGAFTLGVLFIFFAFQKKRISQGINITSSNHPDAMARYLNILIRLDKNCSSESIEMKEAYLYCMTKGYFFSDLVPVAQALGMQEFYFKFVLALKAHGAAVDDLVRHFGTLKESLEECKQKTRERYFFKGQPITKQEYQHVEKFDEYNLLQQGLVFDVGGERIEIPFIDEIADGNLHLDVAKKYHLVGFNDRSLCHLKQGLNNDPTNTALKEFLEQVLNELGDSRQFILNFLRDEGIKWDFAEEIFKKIAGENATWESNLEKINACLSLRVVTRCVLFKNEVIHWLIMKGIFHVNLEQYDASIETYSLALLHCDNEKQNENLLLNRAKSYLTINNLSLGIDDLNEGIKIAPTNADYYSTRGVAFIRSGDLTSALIDFKKAIELEPACFRHLQLSETYRRMNLLSDAKVEIERGIALDPTDSQCYVQYAIVLRELKDHEQLIFCCSKLIELGTERNYALINRAKSLAALGRTQDALKDFDTIISESLPSAEAALKAKAIIS